MLQLIVDMLVDTTLGVLVDTTLGVLVDTTLGVLVDTTLGVCGKPKISLDSVLKLKN